MIVSIVALSLLGAEPCASSVHVFGDDPPAATVRQALETRGVAATTARGCSALVARVAVDGKGLSVELVVGPRRVQRAVADAAMAAVVIEAWVRRDLVASLLAPPTESPNNSVARVETAGGRPRALKPSAAVTPRLLLAKADPMQVSTSAPEPPTAAPAASSMASPMPPASQMPPIVSSIAPEPTPPIPAVAIAPAATPASTAALASNAARGAPPVVDLAPLAPPSPDSGAWSVGASVELGLDETGTLWWGGRARATRQLGPIQAVASLRFAATRASSILSSSPTDRTVGEVLLGARLPFALGPMKLEPSLSIGPHLAVASRASTDRDRVCAPTCPPIVQDGLRVTDVTPAGELAITAVWPLSGTFALDLGASATWTPLSSGADIPLYASGLPPAQAAQLALSDHPDVVARIALGAHWETP